MNMFNMRSFIYFLVGVFVRIPLMVILIALTLTFIIPWVYYWITGNDFDEVFDLI